MNIDHFKLGKLLITANGANIRVDPVHTSVILTTSHRRDFGNLTTVDELFPHGGVRWFKANSTFAANRLPKALMRNQVHFGGSGIEFLLTMDDLILIMMSLS